jgi:Cyclin, C-terminal domain
MEEQILVTLSGKVNPITTSNFMEFFLRLMPHHSTVSVDGKSTYKLALIELLELSRYVSELAACDATISHIYLPSKIAMACIFVSLNQFKFTAIPSTVRNDFQSTLMQIYNSNCSSTTWNNEDDGCTVFIRLASNFDP